MQSIKSSELFHKFLKYSLYINVRQQQCIEYNKLLLEIGNGEKNGEKTNTVMLNKKYFVEDVIDSVFDVRIVNEYASNNIFSSVILGQTNKDVSSVNEKVLEKNTNELKEIYSIDFFKSESDSNPMYTTEYFISITLSGYPPHILKIKVGAPVIH